MIDFNTPENLAACGAIVRDASRLLYYSHIPTAGVALLIGVFVLWKDKGSLISKLLLALSVAFALWTTIDLIVWFGYARNTLLMFAWSFFGILNTLVYILSLYFVYVFIDKKDISFRKKLFLGTFFLPVIFLTPTTYNLINYDTVNCVATEGKYFTNYYLFFSLFIAIWILGLAFVRYRKVQKEFKKQIVFLTLGISFFLLSFFTTVFLASYLIDNGYIANGDYNMEQYGLFGMPIFMGFLAYLIVKFKAFNIKLLATNALVISLVILVGSELFFANNLTNQILILVTLLISIGFGYVLVKSVKLEVQRKEELQMMADQLAIANDKLRELDNAKSEFISIASHQLRTPLTAIKGFVSLILEGTYGKVSSEIDGVLNKIYTANERLIDLVENLLNVSRIESGRIEYDFKEAQIENIIKEITDTFMIEAKERKLDLDVKLPEKLLPLLTIDAQKIKEVISNLISNALKYTKKGGITVRVERTEIPNIEKIRITVSDTGIGIPPAEIPKLFTKFTRATNTKNYVATGTGLGLYVAKNIVEAHQGKIWVESDGEDKGSRFIVELPIYKT